MKWLSTDTIYEDLPLYLRKPDYDNIWNYHNKFNKLLCINHKLDKVKNNGLPESEYNLSLSEFDGDLSNLLDNENEGIIFLIETYGGSRNYWYYVSSDFDYLKKIDLIKEKYPDYQIEANLKPDYDWGFIKEYPVSLY